MNRLTNAAIQLIALVVVAGCIARRTGPGGSGGPQTKEVVARTDGKAGIRAAIGERFTVLERGSFGLEHFPDMATLEVAREPELQLLVTAKDRTYLLHGPDLMHLTGAKPVLLPGGHGSFDNGYAGMSGLYRDPGGRLYGFYHAEDQENMPPIPWTGIPGFHASIALAISSDTGATWQKVGPVVTSEKPKGWVSYPGQPDSGAAEAGVVADPDGRFLYLYYDEHSRVGGRGIQVCLARADLRDGPPLPGKWTKYHEGSFSQPGLGGFDTPVISAKAWDDAEAMFPHPVYSKSLKRYVMILNVDVWKEWMHDKPVTVSGFYVAFSEDAVRWSTPELLFLDNTVPANGRSLSWEGAILWSDREERRGYLVYGYSERWPMSHYMAAREIAFEPVGR